MIYPQSLARLAAAAGFVLLLSAPVFAQKDPAPPSDDGKPGESAPEAVPEAAPESAPEAEPAPETAPEPAPEAQPAPTPLETPEHIVFGGSPLEIAAATMAFSEGQLPADFEPGSEAFLGDPANEQPALTLGNAALMRRALTPAAWYFANAVARDPVNPAALNNLGVTLAELDAIDFESGAPGPLLPSALSLFDAARGIDPSRAAFHANYGETVLLMHQQGEEGPGLEAAREALETAAGLDDALSLHLLHLAEVLAAMGEFEAAAAILAEIHREMAFHPAYLLGMQAAGMGGGGATPWPQPDRSYCTVNFDCLNNCPPGIIGRVQVINCEIAQQDAVLACQAGEPYATSYDCSEEFPRFGILIPGLNSGFSVRTPWGGFDVLHQGDRIDFRFQVGPDIQGPFSPQISGQGSWDPRNGLSVSQVRGDLRYNFLHRNRVGAEAGRYDFPPVFAEGHVGGDTTVDVGVYNGSLWSY